ncbi:IS3 family transposase, partial [Klebsiella quasipneumoniae]|uniref:IS3 family transposase n=3 Tax=Enterobacterales TaxID=91347 RepID=UPI00350FAB99
FLRTAVNDFMDSVHHIWCPLSSQEFQDLPDGAETTLTLRRRLQKERIRKRIYKTRDLARADIFDYIEVFYNRARRHSHLGGVSPEAFEQASS